MVLLKVYQYNLNALFNYNDSCEIIKFFFQCLVQSVVFAIVVPENIAVGLNYTINNECGGIKKFQYAICHNIFMQ